MDYFTFTFTVSGTYVYYRTLHDYKGNSYYLTGLNIVAFLLYYKNAETCEFMSM